ncbi:hypothetical protein [Chitinophaga caseinilytica]|uniref:Rod shape-determining protein MreD n=1 Tax=Chitinophaga caseinilytica TaxID=2267521 RepID=A0ABZ2Z5G6_9BACT
MERKSTPSLIVCVVMDLIGLASYAVPLLGEVSDVIWAPISAVVFYRLFGGPVGLFGGAFNFIEELFPGLDFIPTFTIARLVVYLSNHWAAQGKKRVVNDLKDARRA